MGAFYFHFITRKVLMLLKTSVMLMRQTNALGVLKKLFLIDIKLP